MNSLSCAFEKIKELTYKDLEVVRDSQTQETADAHEKKICEFLREFNILPLPREVLSGGQIELIKNGNFKRLAGKVRTGNWYIHQPCNTQRAIDILIQYNNKFVPIECKSGKATSTFNGTFPKEGVIYIFTEQDSNSTTFFLGNEISPEVRAALLEGMEKLREFAREISIPILDMPGNNLGFMIYGRGKYEQRGGGEITRFCQRADKKDMEQRVLDFIETSSGDRDPGVKRYFRTLEYFEGEIVELPDGRKGVVTKIRGPRFDIILNDDNKKVTTLQHKQPVNPEIRNKLDFTEKVA